MVLKTQETIVIKQDSLNSHIECVYYYSMDFKIIRMILVVAVYITLVNIPENIPVSEIGQTVLLNGK